MLKGSGGALGDSTSSARDTAPEPLPLAAAASESARAWAGQGGFAGTSTFEFSDEMSQGKGPLFETSTRDDLSSKNESKRVRTDRDTSLKR